MPEQIEVRAKWRARRESLEACVERVHRYFALLAAIDPRLATWYEKGRSKKDALRRQPDMTDRAVIARLLEKGRSRGDTDDAVLEDLGYTLALWNGRDDPDGADLRVKVGLWTPHLLNSVDFNPPESLDPVADRETFVRLVEAIADAFEPGWADARHTDSTLARPVKFGRPFLDWMLYLPRRIAAVPSPAEVRPAPHGGSLVITWPEPFAPDNQSIHPHLAAVGKTLGFDPFEGEILGAGLPRASPASS